MDREQVIFGCTIITSLEALWLYLPKNYQGTYRQLQNNLAFLETSLYLSGPYFWTKLSSLSNFSIVTSRNIIGYSFYFFALIKSSFPLWRHFFSWNVFKWKLAIFPKTKLSQDLKVRLFLAPCFLFWIIVAYPNIKTSHPVISSVLKKKHLFSYLAAPGLSCSTGNLWSSVAICGI